MQYDTPVGPSTKFYDDGVELSPEGFFGHHDYIQHATRGTLTIQSLYLILWSNFCGFCIALLTQEDAEMKLAGRVISEEQSIRQYCVTQMYKMWNLLKEGLNISEEERLLLVRGCLNNLLEVHSILACVSIIIDSTFCLCSMTLCHLHLCVGNSIHMLNWIAMNQLGTVRSF